MKKDYEAPKAEKLEFNYSESVVACGSDETQDTSDTYNSDPNGQYFKCTCTTYSAPGWGQNCS